MELAELAFEHAPIGIAVTEQRIIRACNPAFAGMFRTSAGQLIDTAIAALYPSEEDYERIGAAGLRRMQENPLYNDERIMRRLGATPHLEQLAKSVTSS
jgi:PAS domain-containing protein